MPIEIGILSAFGAASRLVEGMIRTKMPIGLQLEGWLEVVPQVLLRSALLCYWVNRPKRWLNVVLGILFSSRWLCRFWGS